MKIGSAKIDRLLKQTFQRGLWVTINTHNAAEFSEITRKQSHPTSLESGTGELLA
jgi:hypothetical protein